MSGFVKLHRTLKDHWLNERPEWFMAWVHILMATDYQSGEVNLTEVYRELGQAFDNRKWRYLIEKLSKDGMLERIETVNHGDKAGYQTTARVSNWFKYHAEERGALRGASAERVSPDARSDSPSETEETIAERGASAERVSQERGALRGVYKEYNLKEVKEDKEKNITPPTPPKSETPKTQPPPAREATSPPSELALASAQTDAKTAKPRTEKGSGAAREKFYELWNERKPRLSPGLGSNREVDREIAKHVKALGPDEFLTRVEAALRFVNGSDFHTTKRPCPPITLLRHLDSYAEQGHTPQLSDANRKLAADAERWLRAAERAAARMSA